nr:hypothetical protein [uncultured Bacteroides sp.]
MEEKKIFLLRLKSKGKAKRIEHIMRSQLGVNFVNIDFENRLMTINFNPEQITIEYMSLLIRSVGLDLIFNEHDVSFWQNKLGNYFVLKQRLKVLYSLSIIAMIIFLSHSSVLFLLGFSILTLILYLSLFIYKSNKHFIRSLWRSDKIGILFSFIFATLGGVSIYYKIGNNLVFSLLFASILIVEMITIYRWSNEKKLLK